MPTTMILLGVITGAHGIRGEVKVKSFTYDPKAVGAYGALQTAEGTAIEFTKLKPAKDHFICTLKNVTDRNQAEVLRGTELFIARDRLPADILLADLVGKAVTHNGQHLGTIIGFQNFGAGELLELGDGLLIPARFITEITETITVTLPEGFLDHPSPGEREG